MTRKCLEATHCRTQQAHTVCRSNQLNGWLLFNESVYLQVDDTTVSHLLDLITLTIWYYYLNVRLNILTKVLDYSWWEIWKKKHENIPNCPLSMMVGRPSPAKTSVKWCGFQQTQHYQSEETELTVRRAHLQITPGIYFQQGLTKHKMLEPYFIPGRTCIQTLSAEVLHEDLIDFPQFLRANFRTVPWSRP